MIKYSWRTINNKLDWKIDDVVAYFYYKAGLSSPIDSKKAQRLVNTKINGDCFILNLKDLLAENNNIINIYNYLNLASRRNIFDYKMRNVRYLHVCFITENEKKWVEYNPLLKLVDDKIYFIYEQ